jgi:hypothetical protein
MAATTTANPPLLAQTKTARKKKAAVDVPSTPDQEQSESVAGAKLDRPGDCIVGQESVYIKDLQK